MKALRLHITGRVQGVSYRASTAQRARALGLTGWVRNEADGSVRAFVQGPAEAVDDLQRWCERGPSPARVTGVMAEASAPDPGLEGFEIRR